MTWLHQFLQTRLSEASLSALYYLRCLLWLLALFVICLCVLELAKKKGYSFFWNANIWRIVQSTVSRFLILILGTMIGYGIRDHQLIENTRTYVGVKVVAQASPTEYSVQIPGYARLYDWEFCHAVKIPGPLIDIKYEQRYGCKEVTGVGFIQIHQEMNQERTNAELQTRRNPPAARTAAFTRFAQLEREAR